MRKGELDCIHGVGHSANNTHGCDGCCFTFARAERERIIKLIKEVPYTDIYVKSGGITLEKHLIALIKGENK